MSNTPLALIDLHDALSDDIIEFIHHGESKHSELRLLCIGYPDILKEYLNVIEQIQARRDMGMEPEDMIKLHDEFSDRVMMFLN